jgi:ribosomal protein S18 acetylase RimI-like enzyme
LSSIVRSDRPPVGAEQPVAPPATTLAAGGASLDCFIVPWDSRIFGFPVAEIARLDLGPDGSDATPLFESFDAWSATNGIRLASCRLEHDRLPETMALEAVGFRFVEIVYRPRLDELARVAPPSRDIEIAGATHDDLADIQAIAHDAFLTGRFLLDFRLSPDLSRRRYADWVRTSLAGGSQRVLKAMVGSEIVGFFIVERRPAGAAYLHLTAIAPAWQGKGIGMSAWQALLRREAAEGVTSIETTISGHNLPVVNMYARLGFTFTGARLTFHRLIDG